MIGLTIGNYLTTHPKLDSLRIAIPGCILRLALLPALMLGLAFVLPISQELKRIIALQVAMPSAVFPILLASHLNGNTQTALRVVLSTSLLSVVTLPLWLTLSLRLIGE
jgi:predicted permease